MKDWEVWLLAAWRSKQAGPLEFKSIRRLIEPKTSPEEEYSNLDTPAYLRQDPRIKGFAENSEVQQALFQESVQPTVEELIQQTMAQGKQDLSL
ncbi:hypothetical protein [Budvicia diplopodorum]|uniref:hypothetical protein n=1 Tax=Budvicia diplopodorum TaxID=1119056 RepID=UPI00135A3ECD|nr:hypothetical protein [Budvicia diplopodorum]